MKYTVETGVRKEYLKGTPLCVCVATGTAEKRRDKEGSHLLWSWEW